MSLNPYLYRHTKGVKIVTLVIVLNFSMLGTTTKKNNKKNPTNVALPGWKTESQQHVWRGEALGWGAWGGDKVNQA